MGTGPYRSVPARFRWVQVGAGGFQLGACGFLLGAGGFLLGAGGCSWVQVGAAGCSWVQLGAAGCRSVQLGHPFSNNRFWDKMDTYWARMKNE